MLRYYECFANLLADENGLSKKDRKEKWMAIMALFIWLKLQILSFK